MKYIKRILFIALLAALILAAGSAMAERTRYFNCPRCGTAVKCVEDNGECDHKHHWWGWCSACAREYNDNGKQIHETTSAWVLQKGKSVEATCGKAGKNVYKCAICNKEKTENVPATGKHKWTAWKTTKAATCVAKGTAQRACSVCGKKETKTIAATGKHTYGNWIITKQATCTEYGTRARTCRVCKHRDYQTINPTGHEWGTWTITQKATCGKAGVRERVCQECQTVQKSRIPATGRHTWGDPEIVKLPSGKTEGTLKYTCKVCGETKTERFRLRGKVGKWVSNGDGTHSRTVITSTGRRIKQTEKCIMQRPAKGLKPVCTKCGYREPAELELKNAALSYIAGAYGGSLQCEVDYTYDGVKNSASKNLTAHIDIFRVEQAAGGGLNRENVYSSDSIQDHKGWYGIGITKPGTYVAEIRMNEGKTNKFITSNYVKVDDEFYVDGVFLGEFVKHDVNYVEGAHTLFGKATVTGGAGNVIVAATLYKVDGGTEQVVATRKNLPEDCMFTVEEGTYVLEAVVSDGSRTLPAERSQPLKVRDEPEFETTTLFLGDVNLQILRYTDIGDVYADLLADIRCYGGRGPVQLTGTLYQEVNGESVRVYTAPNMSNLELLRAIPAVDGLEEYQFFLEVTATDGFETQTRTSETITFKTSTDERLLKSVTLSMIPPEEVDMDSGSYPNEAIANVELMEGKNAVELTIFLYEEGNNQALEYDYANAGGNGICLSDYGPGKYYVMVKADNGTFTDIMRSNTVDVTQEMLPPLKVSAYLYEMYWHWNVGQDYKEENGIQMGYTLIGGQSGKYKLVSASVTVTRPDGSTETYDFANKKDFYQDLPFKGPGKYVGTATFTDGVTTASDTAILNVLDLPKHGDLIENVILSTELDDGEPWHYDKIVMIDGQPAVTDVYLWASLVDEDDEEVRNSLTYKLYREDGTLVFDGEAVSLSGLGVGPGDYYASATATKGDYTETVYSPSVHYDLEDLPPLELTDVTLSAAGTVEEGKDTTLKCTVEWVGGRTSKDQIDISLNLEKTNENGDVETIVVSDAEFDGTAFYIPVQGAGSYQAYVYLDDGVDNSSMSSNVLKLENGKTPELTLSNVRLARTDRPADFQGEPWKCWLYLSLTCTIEGDESLMDGAAVKAVLDFEPMYYGREGVPFTMELTEDQFGCIPLEYNYGMYTATVTLEYDDAAGVHHTVVKTNTNPCWIGYGGSDG